jgi:hypothetical protein
MSKRFCYSALFSRNHLPGNKINTRRHTKFVHEGNYAAESEIEIINPEDGWAPYISLDDALKLDRVILPVHSTLVWPLLLSLLHALLPASNLRLAFDGNCPI